MNHNTIIHFPDFERDLANNDNFPNYPEGKFLYKEGHQSEVHEFPNGIWIVFFPMSQAPMNKLKVCVQINKNKVIGLFCSCYKVNNCPHAICALFHIRQKYVDSDFEESVVENYEEDEREYGSCNSFIDDREYSDEPGSSEEDEDLPNENVEKNSQDQDTGLKELEHEFKCQICLEEMEVPILLPCYSHSICYTCAVELFEKKQKTWDGKRKLNCPTCGDKHCFMIEKIDELKDRINKELKRLISSYKQEKDLWLKRENELKAKIHQYEETLEINNNNSQKEADLHTKRQDDCLNKEKKMDIEIKPGKNDVESINKDSEEIKDSLNAFNTNEMKNSQDKIETYYETDGSDFRGPTRRTTRKKKNHLVLEEIEKEFESPCGVRKADLSNEDEDEEESMIQKKRKRNPLIL